MRELSAGDWGKSALRESLYPRVEMKNATLKQRSIDAELTGRFSLLGKQEPTCLRLLLSGNSMSD
jgi:hypothetical protein